MNLEKFVKNAENRNFHPAVVFIYIFAVSFFRYCIEFWVTKLEMFTKPLILQTILHFNSFYFAVFLVAVTIISFFSKQRIKKVVNFIMHFYWINCLPPIIDIFVFNNRGYDYALPENFIYNLLTFFFNDERSGKGLVIVLVAMNLGASLYVYLKTKSVKRAVLNFFTIYLMSALFSTPGLFMKPRRNQLTAVFIAVSCIVLFVHVIRKLRRRG